MDVTGDACPRCGQKLVPMVFTSFCPNDCDRADVCGDPDSHTVSWGDQVWTARVVRMGSVPDAHPIPDGSRGWWARDERVINDFLRRPQSIGDQLGPGWEKSWAIGDLEDFREGLVDCNLIVLTRKS